MTKRTAFVGIIDSTGDLVVKYNYTAHGDCTVTYNSEGIAEINPFRYKGYYYDSESGMYYCNSRYYVPEWCRWLTADSPSFLQPESLNGMNLFAYCGNDPVNKYDPSGWSWKSFWSGVGSWFKKNIGFATLISESYGFQSDYILYREAYGAELKSDIINGNFDKPITFFAQGTNDSWHLAEYEAGVSINLGKGGVEMAISLCGGVNFAFNNGSISHEVSIGAFEIGYKNSSGVDFENKTAEAYNSWHFRPIVLAPALIGLAYGIYPAGSPIPAF